MDSSTQQQILALGRLGWTLRRIQRETGVRRETVSAYLRSAGVVVRGRGRPGEATTKPAISGEVSTDPPPSPWPPPSRALKRFKSIDQSIHYHMNLIAAFMKRACLISSQLSPSMQIGLIEGDDSRELLDVLALDGFDVAPLELKGDELKD